MVFWGRPVMTEDTSVKACKYITCATTIHCLLASHNPYIHVNIVSFLTMSDTYTYNNPSYMYMTFR